MAKVTDEQIATVLKNALDRHWGGESYADGMGGGLHQVSLYFDAVVEDGAIVIGADNQGFYDVPLNIEALRSGFAAIGIEL